MIASSQDRQDPLALPKPAEPFRGILPFRLNDWRVFFERERETERLTSLVSLYRGALVYGQSGSGKSSLVNAGLLVNAWRNGRVPERIRLYPERGRELFIEPIAVGDECSAGVHSAQAVHLPSRFTDPEAPTRRVQLSCPEFLERLRASASDKLGPPLLFFDQFEELVTLFERTPDKTANITEGTGAQAEIQKLILQLLVDTTIPVKLVFAFRDDYLARLTPLFSQVPRLLDQAVRLEPLKVESLRPIIRGPFIPSEERGIAQGDFSPELTEELAAKIEVGVLATQPSGLLNLSEVQTVCLALWRSPRLRDELLRPGANPGAILGRIIESEAMARLRQFRPWDRARAIAVLSNLVTEDGTRNVVPHEMLVNQTRRDPTFWLFRGKWQKFLGERLPASGLVRRNLTSGSHYYYELAAESLIPRIKVWQQRLRRRRRIWAIVVAIVAIAVPTWQWRKARVATKAARSAEARVLAVKKDLNETLYFMQDEVGEALRRSGRSDVLDKINQQVIVHFEKFPPGPKDFGGLRAQALAIAQRADLRMQNGTLEGTLEEYEKASAIFRRLASENPKDPNYARDVAIAGIQVGDALRAQGRIQAALERYQASLATVQDLAKTGAVDVQRDLSVLYERTGGILNAQGDTTGALKNYQAGLDIAESLANADADDYDKQRDVLISHGNIGGILDVQSDLSGARDHYAASLAIAEKWARESSTDKVRQRDLIYCHNSVAAILRQQGDFTGAQTHYQESMRIAEALLAGDPEDVQSKISFADCFHGLGDIYSDQRDFPRALEHYSRAREIFHGVIPAEGNVEWKRELSLIIRSIGDALEESGSHEEALRTYKEGIAITHELLEKGRDNFDWQADLAGWQGAIGKALNGLHDLAAASASLRECLTIREKLSPRDPANATLQANLAWAYWQMAVVSAEMNPAAKAEATAMLRKGVEILRGIKQRAVEQERWLAESQADLTKLETGT